MSVAETVIKEIVVIGSCVIDFVCYSPRFPKEGETIHGYKFSTNFGGKGANQCVAAAFLGGNTALVSRIGDDFWGDKYLDHLNEIKVDTSFVQKTPNFSTGIAQITVSESGQNQIVLVAGANSQLSTADVEAASSLIKNSEVTICQLETSIDVAIKALTLSTKISILNASPSLKSYDDKLLKLPTIFCVNELEIEDFSGIKVNSIEDGKNAVQILLNKGCENVVLTLGAKGALYASQNCMQHIAAPQANSVDTTGAGDAFIGALAYILVKKKCDIPTAIKFACFAASTSVTKPGTQISFPNQTIFEKFDF